MAVVYSKVLLFDPPLIYTAPDTGVFGAVPSHNLSDFDSNTIEHSIAVLVQYRHKRKYDFTEVKLKDIAVYNNHKVTPTVYTLETR